MTQMTKSTDSEEIFAAFPVRTLWGKVQNAQQNLCHPRSGTATALDVRLCRQVAFLNQRQEKTADFVFVSAQTRSWRTWQPHELEVTICACRWQDLSLRRHNINWFARTALHTGIKSSTSWKYNLRYHTSVTLPCHDLNEIKTFNDHVGGINGCLNKKTWSSVNIDSHTVFAAYVQRAVDVVMW